MKTLKSYILGLAAIAAMTVGFTACQDDFDAPGVEVPAAGIEANMTILELKEMFWDEATNYATTIEDPDDPERRFIIHGRVCSSDEAGNVFKSLVIEDETAAIAFSINAYNLYLQYRVGQEIVLDVTGMDIGKYAGLQQIGRKSWYENGSTWQVSFMSLETFQQYARLNGMPSRPLVDTLVLSSFAPITQQTPEVLREYQSRLVRFQNVYFPEGGQRTFSVYHTSTNEDQNNTLVDRTGASLTVRTSGYCTFFSEVLPVGNIDLVGILSYYNNAWQIIMIDAEGVIPVGEQPGTLENPYTVDRAIQEEADGLTASGWVKGYIVGTTAPEVETVTSASDIQLTPPFYVNSNIVIAASPEETDYTKCMVVQLPMGSVFQQTANLLQNEGNLGREIMVQGNLTEYLGTYGITGNGGTAADFSIEGVDVPSGEIGEGTGTQASPYNVAQVIAKNPTDKDTALESDVWVEGYIVGYMPSSPSTTLPNTVFSADGAVTTNIVLGPTPDCTDYTKCVGVQLPNTAVRTALNLSANPGNLGARLNVKGNLIKYCGSPGVGAASEYVLGDVSDVPVTPPTEPSVTPEGNGTEASPYNVSRALSLITGNQIPADAVYVKGTISAIDEIDTSFGNATFDIVDAAGEPALKIYRSYYFNGDKYSSTDQLAVGAEVVVYGTLVYYNNEIPEMTTGGKLISYNGQTSGTETPEDPTPSEPTDPATPSGDVITVEASQITAPASKTEPGVTEFGGYTITVDQGSGASTPIVHTSGQVRLYANTKVTISGPAMAKIVFNIPADATNMKNRYTDIKPSTGEISPKQAAGDTTATWIGDATSVTFTVDALGTYGVENTKPGQFFFTSVEIYPAE